MDVILPTLFMTKNSTPDTKLGHVNEPIIIINVIVESKRTTYSTIYGITFAATVELVSILT